MSDETKVGEANAGFETEPEESAEAEQARAWFSVFDFCRSLGMGCTVGKTGLQEVQDFIGSLVFDAAERAVLAAAEEWREADKAERTMNHNLYGGYGYVTDAQLVQYRAVKDEEVRARCALRDAVDALRPDPTPSAKTAAGETEVSCE